MNGQVSEDARSLERKARRREEREATASVLEAPGIRVILGSRISDDGLAIVFIEASSYYDRKLHASYDDVIAMRQRLDKALENLGCSTYDDDLDHIWEVVTTEERWAADLDCIRRAVARAFQPDLPDPIGQ